MVTCQTFCLQKKANLAVLEQERAKARAKEAHLEKLQDEEEKISEALEESPEVRKSPLCHSKPVKSDTLIIPFKGHMCFFMEAE